MLTASSLILFAYLLGSLASAIIVCKLMGLTDPRTDGSGNPGATNVLRLHGKKAGALAFAGDMLKGVIPVLLARFLDVSAVVVGLAGLSAFIGHLFPLFFGFKGGKGVATLFGVLIATGWQVGLLFALSWFLAARLSGYSSLGGITAAMLSPVFAFWLLPHPAYAATIAVMSALLLWRHRGNISRLLAGTESKIKNSR